MIDSDEDILKGVVDHNAKRRHKVVVWSVEETRQFYEVSGVAFPFQENGSSSCLVLTSIWNRLLHDEQGAYQAVKT